MRKSAHVKNAKSDVHLEMGDAKEHSAFNVVLSLSNGQIF